MRVTCPHCDRPIDTARDPDTAFEFQGRMGGKSIIKCGGCGNGMLKGMFGKPRPIPADVWAKHQAYMWEHFDSPEARARSMQETEEILRRVREEGSGD